MKCCYCREGFSEKIIKPVNDIFIKFIHEKYKIYKKLIRISKNNPPDEEFNFKYFDENSQRIFIISNYCYTCFYYLYNMHHPISSTVGPEIEAYLEEKNPREFAWAKLHFERMHIQHSPGFASVYSIRETH